MLRLEQEAAMDQPRSRSRADHVIGILTRENLSLALSAVHRAGFGQHVRVFDGTRQPLGDQISRAGLRLLDAPMFQPDDVMIVVTAPGRTALVAEMLHETNAERVIFAERASPEKWGEQVAPIPPPVDIVDVTVTDS